MAFSKQFSFQRNPGTGTTSQAAATPSAMRPVQAPAIIIPDDVLRSNRVSAQQEAIIRCDGSYVVGQAFAGTGKSTTGVTKAKFMLAKDPRQKILSICFNASNAAELKGKYPKANTKVLTTHGLAYGSLSEKQRTRLARGWSPVSVKHEMELFGHRNASYRLAAAVHSVLNHFFVDVAERVDPHLHGKEAMGKLHCNQNTVELACAIANQMWLAMNSDDPVPGMVTSANTMAIPHNAYLKNFVMKGFDPLFHTIIFDEAQDANPIMLKLLHDQHRQGANILLLGDRHQSIYEFNGAINTLEEECFPEDTKVDVLPLTQSWRFGKSTADVANFILSELKGETREIEGCGQDGSYKSGDPYAYLSRTNANTLAMAVSRNGEGVHWVGGIEGYRIEMLGDAYSLKTGRSDLIRDNLMKKHYPSWHEFERAAEFDQEPRTILKLIEQFGDSIPEIELDLVKNQVKDSRQADLTLATGHKSKGLEWNYVRLGDDFKNVFSQAEAWLSEKTAANFPEQEVNLMYVLATRAKLELQPNKEMNEWFDKINLYRKQRKRSWADYREPESEADSTASRTNTDIGGVFAGIAPAPI